MASRRDAPTNPGERGQAGPSAGKESLPAEIKPPPAEPASPEEAAESLRIEALEAVNRLIADLPERPEPVALLALAHSRFGNGAEAKKCWQRCLELDPDFAGAYDGLGRLALNVGEFEQAAAHLRKALAMVPKLPEVRGLLADALMSLGKIDEAVVVLEEDIRLFPRNAESLLRLGKAHQQLKEHEKAKGRFEAAIEIDPECMDAYYGLASVCVRLKQGDEARKYRAKFAELKAADEQDSDGRRQVVYRPERLRQAAAAMHLAAGNVYSRQGDLRKAEQRWSRTAALDPQDVASRHQLALLYLQQDRASTTNDYAITRPERIRGRRQCVVGMSRITEAGEQRSGVGFGGMHDLFNTIDFDDDRNRLLAVTPDRQRYSGRKEKSDQSKGYPAGKTPPLGLYSGLYL